MKYRVAILIVFMLIALAFPVFAGGRAESARQPSQTGELTGELVIMNWFVGAMAESVRQIQEAFMAVHPGVTIKNVDVSGLGDNRVRIRTALLSGEKFDLIINTWPSFEKELIEAGFLRPLDEAWERFNWNDKLSQSWRDLATYDGNLYGLYFISSNRSGVWYHTETMQRAGIDKLPTTWDELIESARALQNAGITPFSVGAMQWAHTEYFENIYLKAAGVDNARRLVNREIPWTHPSVRETLTLWADLLQQGFFPPAEQMFALDWADANDQVLDQRTAGFNIMGHWVNGRAISTYGLEPETDFSFFQFPTINPQFANTMSIDGRNFLATASSPNPRVADEFLDFVISEQAANIIAGNGLSTPSSKVDQNLFDVNTAKFVPLLNEKDVFFVMDDLLPAAVSTEFRAQLQNFLANPTNIQIDAFMQAMEKIANQEN